MPSTAGWLALLALAMQATLAGCDRVPDPGEASARALAGGLAIDIGPGPTDGFGVSVGSNTEAPYSGAGELRRLESAIAGLRCSRLQVVALPGAAGFELRGHVPASETASELVANARRLLGGTSRVTRDLMVLSPPLCAVLEAVEATGLPLSGDQRNDPLAVGRRAWDDMPRALDGEAAVFRFQAPDYDAHIYVDYFIGDGTVVHLLPSEYQSENRFRANAEFDIGRSERGPRLVFSPPLGVDIALVVASTEPLHGGARPYMEDARTYLAWLDDRIRTRRDERPSFRGEWAFMLIRTEPG